MRYTKLPNPPTKTVTVEEFTSNADAFISAIPKEYLMKKIDRRRYTKERNIFGRQEVYDSSTEQWLLLSMISNDSSGIGSYNGMSSSFSGSGGSFGGGGASSSYDSCSSSSDSGGSGGCD